MRWFLRRLAFYVFALWVAVTLNFLLPRLMPGDPLGGVLQRLTPAQLASNPGSIQTYRTLLGGGNESLWYDVPRLPAPASCTLDFGISTSNYPTRVSDRDRAHAAVLDLPRRRRLHPRVRRSGSTIGMLAAWRRGGVVDNVVVPTLLSISAFPAFFTSLVAVYFLGLKLGWFPLQHAYDTA